jgi:hypothetical protein
MLRYLLCGVALSLFLAGCSSEPEVAQDTKEGVCAFRPTHQLQPGLTLYKAVPGDEICGSYRVGDQAVHFQAIRGEDLVFGENTIDPDAPAPRRFGTNPRSGRQSDRCCHRRPRRTDLGLAREGGGAGELSLRPGFNLRSGARSNQCSLPDRNDRVRRRDQGSKASQLHRCPACQLAGTEPAHPVLHHLEILDPDLPEGRTLQRQLRGPLGGDRECHQARRHDPELRHLQPRHLCGRCCHAVLVPEYRLPRHPAAILNPAVRLGSRPMVSLRALTSAMMTHWCSTTWSYTTTAA